MVKDNTKQRILTEAVKLFARDGYEAVTVEQIAKSVGIKAPSLYKHYKSKRDIFNCILDRMSRMDYERAQDYGVPEGSVEEMAGKYADTSLRQIKEFSEAQFQYWTEDEFPSAFRKMLTIEQYRSREMSQLYQQYIGAGPVSYMADLFAEITGDRENGMKLAIEYYSPMILLYSLSDAAPEEEEKKKIADMFRLQTESFIERFKRDYDIERKNENE